MNFIGLKKYVEEEILPKLSSNLYYHGPHHTQDVYESAMRISAYYKLDEASTVKIGAAALLHDAGYIIRYADNESLACEMARKLLPEFGFSEKDCDEICGMIMATQVPQKPSTLAEQILCDADLDYLGRDDFQKGAENLYQEFLDRGIVRNMEHWDEVQVRFITNHQFFTEYSTKFREPAKQIHLQNLLQKLA